MSTRTKDSYRLQQNTRCSAMSILMKPSLITLVERSWQLSLPTQPRKLPASNLTGRSTATQHGITGVTIKIPMQPHGRRSRARTTLAGVHSSCLGITTTDVTRRLRLMVVSMTSLLYLISQTRLQQIQRWQSAQLFGFTWIPLNHSQVCTKLLCVYSSLTLTTLIRATRRLLVPLSTS